MKSKTTIHAKWTYQRSSKGKQVEIQHQWSRMIGLHASHRTYSRKDVPVFNIEIKIKIIPDHQFNIYSNWFLLLERKNGTKTMSDVLHTKSLSADCLSFGSFCTLKWTIEPKSKISNLPRSKNSKISKFQNKVGSICCLWNIRGG